MGFLHHAKYFTYFEISRMEMFRSIGGDYRKMEEEGMFVVVVSAKCRFRKPARFDDELTIRTTITEVSMAKLLHEYVVLRGDERLAVAEVTLALVDRTGTAQRIPDWFRDMH